MSTEVWEDDGGYTPPDLASLHNCARCGEHHIRCIDWRRFQNPVVDDDVSQTEWTHWALCPTTGDPILMRSE